MPQETKPLYDKRVVNSDSENPYNGLQEKLLVLRGAEDSTSSRGGMKDGSIEKNIKGKVHFYLFTFKKRHFHPPKYRAHKHQHVSSM